MQKKYEDDINSAEKIQLKDSTYSKQEINEIIKKYWREFTTQFPIYINSPYEVWSFGYGDYQANSLLGLVKQGLKTGTSSAYDMYEENERKPEVNDISIVTFGNGLPGCIIKTTEVKHKKFDEISEQEAAFEGEGDLSLNYWRTVHENFFKEEYKESEKEFNNKIPVIYERFKVIYDEDIR